MPHDLHITVGRYTVIRVAEPGSITPFRYDVIRPDGSFCCQGVTWADVESAISKDAQSRGPAGNGAPSGTT